MIELVDTQPDTDVKLAEYMRLLGYPRDRKLRSRARELAIKARRWYRAHGKPWVYARQADSLDITNGSICIDGVSFVSTRLQSMLQHAHAESVILVAVGAGPELEAKAQQLWQDEKPDEYFFLEVYGSAVVEHLVTMQGARLCAWAEARQAAILPHYSPGYPDWDISQQPRLLELIRSNEARSLPGNIDVLDSGMLRPKKSLLAVFGFTRHTANVRRLTELSPCESCSFLSCQYRRAPYSGAPRYVASDILADTKRLLSRALPNGSPLDRDASYAANRKALARWAAERLTLTQRDNGTTDALFRYEGTTCSNLGRPLHFHYRVKLGPREIGYPIQEQICRPAPGDVEYRSMCRYLAGAEPLLAAIDSEKPFLGQSLNRVLSWQAATSPAGCYCNESDRMHKWRLVLETIHYALAEREQREEQEATREAIRL